MSNSISAFKAEFVVHSQADIKVLEKDFVKLIHQRLGIVVHPHQLCELQKTIVSACHQFNCNPKQYLEILNDCAADSPLLEYLIVRVTIGETYFFRDQKQIQLLKDFILPSLIREKRKQADYSLRIWSAGCASGEEIYTIAMLLSELIPDIHAWTLHLLATDLNTAALKKAMAGRYTEWSMRTIPEMYKKRYFTWQKGLYQLSNKLIELVNFDYLNLNEDSFPSIVNETNAQDLIICRNVFIYFVNERVAELMKKLHASLNQGGYLLLGASDPVNIESTKSLFHYTEGMLFTKKSPVEIPAKKAKSFPVAKHDQNKETKNTEIKKTPLLINYEVITAFIEEKRWQDILDTLTHYQESELSPSFVLSAKATAFANLGKLAEAVALCNQSLLLDATNTQTYFTLAMALVELNKAKEAEAALRKTLFLDRQFVMGHFQLGLLLIKTKNYSAGIKSLMNALNIVKSKDPTQIAMGSPGLANKRLAEILEHEIELHAHPKGINNGN